MFENTQTPQLESVSLKVLFEQFAIDLENDEYVIHPDYDGVVRTCDVDDNFE